MFFLDPFGNSKEQAGKPLPDTLASNSLKDADYPLRLLPTAFANKETSKAMSNVGAVLARYGAPLGCSEQGGVLRLSYLGADGNAVADAVQLADGVVVVERQGLRATPAAADERGCLGHSIERVLPRLGAPLRVRAAGEATELEFEGLLVTVYSGVIACAVPILPSVLAPTPRASA